jgi:hypothetical protein
MIQCNQKTSKRLCEVAAFGSPSRMVQNLHFARADALFVFLQRWVIQGMTVSALYEQLRRVLKCHLPV